MCAVSNDGMFLKLIFVTLLTLIVGYYAVKVLLNRRRAGMEASEAQDITDSFEIPRIEERPSWTTIDKPAKNYAPPAVESV